MPQMSESRARPGDTHSEGWAGPAGRTYSRRGAPSTGSLFSGQPRTGRLLVAAGVTRNPTLRHPEPDVNQWRRSRSPSSTAALHVRGVGSGADLPADLVGH